MSVRLFLLLARAGFWLVEHDRCRSACRVLRLANWFGRQTIPD